jgi:surface protein
MIAGKITNGDYNLCTTLVTDMSNLFSNNTSFNSDIGFWDTSNVTTMQNMFRYSSFNQNIGSWITSKVVNMEHIFADTPFNQNISNWDVSKVVTFERAFAYSSFNQPIGSWNISSATNISGMFRGSNESNKTVFNQNISGWNTSNVVIASEVFAYSRFNQNIGAWNMSNVRLLTAMFTYNSDFNQNISGWNLSSMTNNNNLINGSNYGDARNRMNGVFRNASSFNQNLSSWCVTDISSEPDFFALNSALSNANKPLWGYCPSSFSINVTASSASDYTLSGTDRSGAVSGNDPSVTINVGDTVNFAVNASGHPFYLKTVQGTGTANTISGVTNNGTTNGTVSWTPTQAGTYYYICSLHGGMVGTITVN